MEKIYVSGEDLEKILTDAFESATKKMAKEVSDTIKNKLLEKRRVIENGKVVIKNTL
jgi:hypothetical protein